MDKLAERTVAALLSQAGLEPKEGEMIGSSFGGAWDSSHRLQCLIKLFPLDLPSFAKRLRSLLDKKINHS